MSTDETHAIVTTIGTDRGNPWYILITEHAAFSLSIADAIRAQRSGCEYVHPSLLTDEERERAESAYALCPLVC